MEQKALPLCQAILHQAFVALYKMTGVLDLILNQFPHTIDRRILSINIISYHSIHHGSPHLNIWLSDCVTAKINSENLYRE